MRFAGVNGSNEVGSAAPDQGGSGVLPAYCDAVDGGAVEAHPSKVPLLEEDLLKADGVLAPKASVAGVSQLAEFVAAGGPDGAVEKAEDAVPAAYGIVCDVAAGKPVDAGLCLGLPDAGTAVETEFVLAVDLVGLLWCCEKREKGKGYRNIQIICSPKIVWRIWEFKPSLRVEINTAFVQIIRKKRSNFQKNPGGRRTFWFALPMLLFLAT